MASTAKKSAGILLFKRHPTIQFFLVHPGGPFWAKKDNGAWSIPKGEFVASEEPLLAAQREFFEETGYRIEGNFLQLSPVKLKSGKTVLAWALEGNVNAEDIKSNLFDLEWPPHSGKIKQFPEVDRAGWFGVEEAGKKINPAQTSFIDELVRIISPA